MTCSVLALNGCFDAMWLKLEGYLFWAEVVACVVIFCVALYILNEVKKAGGTWAEIGLIGAALALWSNWRGRHGKGILPLDVKLDFGAHENVPADSPDAAPASTVLRVRPRPFQPSSAGKSGGLAGKPKFEDEPPTPSLGSH